MYILQVALHMHVWYDVIVMYVLLFGPSWFGFGMRGADLEHQSKSQMGSALSL